MLRAGGGGGRAGARHRPDRRQPAADRGRRRDRRSIMSVDEAERVWSTAIDRYFVASSVWPEQHVRQIQRRVRRLRHLRSSRSRQHDLPRAVRAAAPRAGERRHRRVRRRSRCAISRAMGYVADVFDGETLSQLPGPLAIGHVRYSTAGESKLLERAADSDRLRARPDRASATTATSSTRGELRDELVRQGSIFQSSSDTEVDPAPLRAIEGARPSRTRSSNRCRRCRARFRS